MNTNIGNRFVTFLYVLLFASLSLAIAIFFPAFLTNYDFSFLWADYSWTAGFISALIGSSVGAIELIGRYQDAPFLAVLAKGAIFYIVINAAISLLAFWGLLIYFPTYGEHVSELKVMLEAAAISGFGSLAIMRSAIAKAQIGGGEISVGPSFFIDILLKAADRSVDRHRAIARMVAVPKSLEEIKDIDYTINDLFLICSNSLQNLETGERDIVDQRMNELAELMNKQEVTPEMVRLMGGMRLQQMVGSDAFGQACMALKRTNPSPIRSIDELASLTGKRSISKSEPSSESASNPQTPPVKRENDNQS